MQEIKNIIFDLGGVILDIDFGRTEVAFAELGFADFRQYFDLGHAASFFKDHEAGKITDEEFLASLQKLSKHFPETGLVQKAWNALLINFPPERIALLKQLRSKYRLFLLSNTNAIHLTAFRKIYSDAFDGGSFDDLFEKVYYSHTLGLRKPQREVYEHVLQENGLDPVETLFIDDALVNVEGAIKTGMQAIHIVPGKTILDLNL